MASGESPIRERENGDNRENGENVENRENGEYNKLPAREW